jgi:hypothetical protein
MRTVEVQAFGCGSDYDQKLQRDLTQGLGPGPPRIKTINRQATNEGRALAYRPRAC